MALRRRRTTQRPTRPRRAVLRARAKLTPEASELREALAGPKLAVAQTAPAVRVALGEEFGHAPGEVPVGRLVGALRLLGFDVVYDTNTGADLCICEEGKELLGRVLARASGGDEEACLPMFTSCCPGWIAYVEKSSPDLIPYLSTCRSPHMMLGSVVKRFLCTELGRAPEDVYFCSVMPCVRKRGESDRLEYAPGGVRDVDNVITTRDLGDLLKDAGVEDVQAIEESRYDDPLGAGTGAGQLFGVTGGVTEAAVRTVLQIVTGEAPPRLEFAEVRGLDGTKAVEVPLRSASGRGLDGSLKIAVVNGLANAKQLIQRMRDGEESYDFVEVMACPGGCIGGGGQPRSKDKAVVEKRMQSVYALDRCAPIRFSHENPAVMALYERFIGEPNSEAAEAALHTTYTDRSGKEGPYPAPFPSCDLEEGEAPEQQECHKCGLRFDSVAQEDER